MAVDLPTQRLSPKHQVTLIKGARALIEAEADGYVCGTVHRMIQPQTGERFPVVVLLSERELQRREDAIRDNPGLSPIAIEAQVARLNGKVQRMNMDAQRRIVLPSHFVRYLRLAQDVFMFSTNTSVMVWNPDDWRRWDGDDDNADDVGHDELSCVMI